MIIELQRSLLEATLPVATVSSFRNTAHSTLYNIVWASCSTAIFSFLALSSRTPSRELYFTSYSTPCREPFVCRNKSVSSWPKGSQCTKLKEKLRKPKRGARRTLCFRQEQHFACSQAHTCITPVVSLHKHSHAAFVPHNGTNQSLLHLHQHTTTAVEMCLKRNKIQQTYNYRLNNCPLFCRAKYSNLISQTIGETSPAELICIRPNMLVLKFSQAKARLYNILMHKNTYQL